MNVDPLKQNPYDAPRGDVADWSGRRLARFAGCWSAGLFALLAGIPLLAISWGLYLWTNRLPLDEWMSSGEPILLSGVVLGGLSAVLAQMMAFRKATWLLTVVGIGLAAVSLPRQLSFDPGEYWGVLAWMTIGYVAIALAAARMVVSNGSKSWPARRAAN